MFHTSKGYNEKRYIFPIFMAILLVALVYGVFFSQFFLSDIVTFAKAGDQMREGFPMFVKVGTMLRTGVLNGTDGGIFNGAAELFYKIHMSKYIPFVLCAYVGSFTSYELMYIFFYAMHFFCLLLFGQLLMNKFFGLSKWQSLFVACSCCSVFFQNNWFAPFAVISALVYTMLYFTLSGLHTNTSLHKIALISFFYVLAFTSGHPVYSCGLAGGVFLVTLLYGILILKSDIKIRTSIIRALLPAVIGGGISFPYLLQILKYTNQYSVAPEIMNMAVSLDSKLNASDILSVFFWSANVTSNSEQQRIFYIGIVWGLILAIAIRKKILNAMPASEKHFFLFLAGGVLLSVLLSLGVDTPVGVWFFSFIPVLGSVHLPVRYALISVPLLFIGFGILLKYINEDKDYKKIIISFSFLLVISIVGAVIFRGEELLLKIFYDGDFLIIESIIALIIFYFAIYEGFDSRKFLLLSSFFMIFTGCKVLYSFSEVNTTKENFMNRSIVYSEEKQAIIDGFVATLPTKEKYRYVTLDKQEDVPGYWPGNYSWYNQSKYNLTNYLGYSLHAYISHAYKREVAQIGDFNHFNWNYLLDTRADFIVTDKECINEYPELYDFLIDDTKSAVGLNEYLIMYPLKKYIPSFFKNKGTIFDYSIDNNNSFDNGYFYSPTLFEENIISFETNDSNYYKLKLFSFENATVSFLPFADQYYSYYLDGLIYKPIVYNGIAYFDINSGEHVIEVVYDNKTEQIVIIIFVIYYLLVAICMIIMLVKHMNWKVQTYKKSRKNTKIK